MRWTPAEVSVCWALSPLALGACGRTVSSWGPSPSRTSWCCRRQEDIRPAAPCGNPDPRAPAPHSPTATNTSTPHQTFRKMIASYSFMVRNAPFWDTAVCRMRRSPTEGLRNSIRLTEWRISAGTETSGWVWTNSGDDGQVSREVSLTLFFKASGAVHLMGNFELSVAVELTLARPKSLILATVSSDTRMLRPARSRCRSFFDSRCSIPSQTSLREAQK